MADTDLRTIRRKKPWALTFFGLLAAGGLIAMPFLAGPPDSEKMPDIVRFIGHFHPVLLHLPIGVFVLIVIQEMGAIFGKRDHQQVANTSLFPLFFGAASAIVAVIAGFLLFQGGEEYAGSALAERHLWGGLAFAVTAVITFILKAWAVALSSNPAFYRILLLGSVSVMSFASHDGATITHGEGYLSKFAPSMIRSLMGLGKKEEGKKGEGAKPVSSKNPNDQIVYTDIVAPIFERRCVQCHKESKVKGKLRMDTYELLMKGGKEGKEIEPGKSAESNLVKRITLPKDDDEHMPPEGKPAPDAGEVAIIKWWIDSGADAKKTISEFEVPAEIKAAIAKLVPAAALGTAESSTSPIHTSTDPDEALKSLVAGISKQYPGALSFESQQSSLLVFTAVSLRGNFDDEGFKKLAPAISQLVTLDLSATKVTDQAVAQLAVAKNLRLIRLSETGVTDACIDTLLKLPTLESINLYGTKVTDAGVSKLSAMPHLKRLYLWKTSVTPEALKALKEKLPGCEIITGIDA